MPKTGHYIHEMVDGGDTAIDATFGVGKQTDLNTPINGDFSGYLEGLLVRVKSIAGGATKITIKITHNTNGTGVVIPDTEAVIALEVGSLTAGAVAYRFAFAHRHEDATFSVFYKTDAGTAVVDVVELYWSE
jgi:hypothetical protein